MSTQFRSDDTVKWWLGFGNGSDGDYSSVGNATDAPVDSSCSGTAGSTSLSATNVSFAADKPILIHQTRGTGAGNWELNQIASYSTGTITLQKALQNTYTDSGASQAQVIQLKQYNNFTQNLGHTLTAKAWDGNVGGIIAFLAKGTVTVTGTISATGKGFIGGNNGGGSAIAYQGEGTGGAGSTSQSANGNGGGGANCETGGSGDRSHSGGGGHANAGGDGTGLYGAANSIGGSAVGTASLTSLNFGGASGGGWKFNGTYTNGSNGSGIVLIIANAVTVSGGIETNGVNGARIGDGDTGTGGSSGGSVLIKSKTATLGATKITANSSTGYSGSNNGSVGRIHLDYSVSYTGTTTPALDVTLDTTIKPVGGSKPLFMAQY